MRWYTGVLVVTLALLGAAAQAHAAEVASGPPRAQIGEEPTFPPKGERPQV